jgi:TIR domain
MDMTTTSGTDPHGKYSIFFSHKTNDSGVTNALKDLLDSNTENVEFHIAEQIEKGANWRKAIVELLNRANFLVLVFTDPNEDWGWCLYETGFFDALSQSESRRRIWCLHNASTDPPDPIAGLQTIPAEKTKVEQWLKELFSSTEQTKALFFKNIPELAEKICELFLIDQKPFYSQRSLNIIADRTLLKSPDDLPDNATIKGDQPLMGELFGTFSTNIDWKSLKERFRRFPNSAEVNLNTLKEISRAIYSVCNHSIVHPAQGIFFVEQGPKRYRPVLSRAKDITKDQIDCEIMLVEDVGGQLQNMDKPLAALLTAIRIAMRIRWEIVRPFSSNVQTLARLDSQKLRFDLQTCFNNIFLEAEFRGNYSTGDLLDAFEGADKEKLLDIIDKWNETYPKIWSGIGFSDVTKTFGEVSKEPMSAEDQCLLQSGLQKLERLNRDYLAMAVPRVEVLIQNELRTNIGVVENVIKASNLHLQSAAAKRARRKTLPKRIDARLKTVA